MHDEIHVKLSMIPIIVSVFTIDHGNSEIFIIPSLKLKSRFLEIKGKL